MRIVFLLCLAALASGARADELRDRFNTVWESLWTQGGSPTYVIRWGKEIRVRYTGPGAARHRDQAHAALQAATEVAGVALHDVSAEDSASEIANLEFRIVGEYDLDDKMPCRATLQRWRSWLLEKVLIEARGQHMWRCAHHEVMHAMGIRGHPSGRTVLSYFPHRRDQLMAMDVLMLKSWYSPQMRLGATPFEALRVMTDAVIDETVPEAERPEARKLQVQFLASTLQEMMRYANGEGEVPTIVLRSGRATGKAMADGQNLMAFFVGVAYFRGIGTAKDAPEGMRWVERAAEKGNNAAKIMLMKKETAAEK